MAEAFADTTRGIAIFDLAVDALGDEPHIYHQKGIYLKRLAGDVGALRAAEEALLTAQELAPTDRTIKHSLSELAYLAGVLGESDPTAYGVSAPIPTLDEMEKTLGPEKVRALQQRARLWQRMWELDKGLLTMVAWLDYTGVSTVRLADSSREDGNRGRAGAHSRERSGSGSGFVISESGHVVTNAHVVYGCEAVTVGAADVPALIVAVDQVNDLALLTTPLKVRPLHVSAAKLQRGTPVSVLGFPITGSGDQAPVVTTGSVSALAGPNGDSRLFQLSAGVHPGNSGGPCCTSSGW